MNEKYYAYYKPNSKVELMNDIKQQLLEEYDSITANKILSQIFTNINCNDTDEYLWSNKYNNIVLIKFTYVNELFMKINNSDKSNYTMVSKTVESVGKKHKNTNYPNHYVLNQNCNYYNKGNSILFNGTTCNYQNDKHTQYIFAEYLTIPLNNLLTFYKNIDFDTYKTVNTNKSKFNQSLLNYEKSNMLNDKIIKSILMLLNTLLSSEDIDYDTDYNLFNHNGGCENQSLFTKSIIPYKTENDALVIEIWNNIYKQPTNVADVFTNHKLIINNEIKYITKDLKSYIEYIYFNVYSYLYITQKQFVNINYKDALPLRLAFDTKFNYTCKKIDINHNKCLGEIIYHTNEINKINITIEKLLRTKSETDNSILRQRQNIHLHQFEIDTFRSKLLNYDPYFRDHLLFTTNLGLKLTFEGELNGYKSLLYLRYVCNNYSRLTYNKMINNESESESESESKSESKNETNKTQPTFLFSYDNIKDKRNDSFEFYVSKQVLNDLIHMKLKADLFTISRLFNITTEDKYNDNSYKITNHEINKTYEISDKNSNTYKKLCLFLDTNINLKLFDYQKNNLLWMLALEDKIDNHNLMSECYSNPYTLANYDDYTNSYDNIKLFIYNLKSYIPEVLHKNYSITNDNQTYYISMKNTHTISNNKSLISNLNANNKKHYSRGLYNNDFNIIDSILNPNDYKAKYNKKIDFCGGAICDEVGLGKTLTIISHLVIKLNHDMSKYNNYKKEVNDLLKNNNLEQCETFNDPLDKGFEFNNLIIVPSRLTSQWESEIEKYVKDKFNLRAKVLVGIHSIKSLEKELREFSTQKLNTKSSNVKSSKKTKLSKINKPTNPIITSNNPIHNEVILETKNVNDVSVNNISVNDVNTTSSDKKEKLSKTQLKINKLMLKAETNNIKNEKKRLIKLKKGIKTSTDKDSNKSSDNVSIETKHNEVDDTIDFKVDAIVDTTLENLINIDTINDPIVIEKDDDVIEEDDTYYYANTYLDCHNSKSANKTDTIENDYMSEQLYDVYIVSINLLSNVNYLSYVNQFENNNLNQYYEGETERIIQSNKLKAFTTFHQPKKTSDTTNDTTSKICRLSNEFNIFKIKWNRVILDEAHEKLCPTVKLFSSSVSKLINRDKSLTFDSQFLYENLCSLQSNYKWAMTGTPTEKGLDTLTGLVQFLSTNKSNDTTLEKISKIRYLRDTSGISNTTMDLLLNDIFKKTFKKDVKTLLNIPIFTEDIIYVEQNNIERNIYNSIRANRHINDTLKLKTLFLMCTNILINNEIDLENSDVIDNSIEPEILTLEQLNSNMISKFNKQLKELDVMKTKLTKNNVELQHKLHSWIELFNYIKSLNLDEKISPIFLQEINSKFKDLDNNRIRSHCEIIYSVLSAFDVCHNPESIQNVLASNLYIIKDHLYRIWNNDWNTNEFIPLKCSEYATMLGHIHIKHDFNKNVNKLNLYESDKVRINNQITLFSNNDFIKDKTQDPCIICFDDLDDIAVTLCRHIFCLECAKKLSKNLTSKFNCPECRGIVDAKTLNITNIDMVNKKPEDELEKEREKEREKENEEKTKIDAVVKPKLLTPLEQKLGSEWKTNCINKYGSKMSALVEYLHNLFINPENRVIIFSQYDKMLKMIGKTLDEFNIKFIYCSGNNYVINKNINKFKKDDTYRVIMLSSERSNSGSNLTEANHIIFIDALQSELETTKATEAQAIGRAVRLGQKLPVKIVRFITKDTIEEEHFNLHRYDINILQE